MYVTLDGARTHIFGGEYVLSRWAYDHSTVDVHARDWAGLLVDQKRVLSSIAGAITSALAPGQVSGQGVETQNQLLSQIVTSIANQFGFTPELHLEGNSSLDVGTVFGGDDSIYWTTPQSLWAILNKLARDTGNEVHVTPDKHLVFGVPGAGLPTIQLTYQVNPPPGGSYPVWGLMIEHNPRRNLSFRVMVLSYDPAKAQLSTGNAYVLGTNVDTGGQTTIKSGLWSSSTSPQVTQALDNASQSKKIPIYTIRVDGLTQQQADAQALAIANDIAKRELILTCSTDGIPSIQPLNPLKISSSVIDPEFTSHTYYANAFSHRFEMSRPGSGHAEFLTAITGLDVQLSGIGDPVLTGQESP